MTPKLLYTAREAAEALSLDVSTVYGLAASGVLERRYVGKRNYRITAESLREYVRSLPQDPPP